MRTSSAWAWGFVVVALLATRAAHAEARTLRGQVVDADGHAVPDADVALAWVASAAGLRAPSAVRTDGAGRFALPLMSSAPATTVWAFDGPRARGGVATVDHAAARTELVVRIGALADVRGTLLNADGKTYPAGATVWVADARAGAYALRVDPERDRFAVRLPVGSFRLLPQAPGGEGDPKETVIAPGAAKVDLGTLSLRDRTGPPRAGSLAPAIRFAEGPPALTTLLESHPRGGRPTLLYFWEHT